MSECKCMVCRIGRALGWKRPAGMVDKPGECPPAPKEYNPISLPPCETYRMKGTPSVTSEMLASDPLGNPKFYTARYVAELEKERNQYKNSAARANFLLEEARGQIMDQKEQIEALKAANNRQAARLAEMEDENTRLKQDNHNLNWALGSEGYTSMATAEEQAEADAAHARVMEGIAQMKQRKDAIESLQERIAELEWQRGKLLEALELIVSRGRIPPTSAAMTQARAAIAEVRGEK